MGHAFVGSKWRKVTPLLYISTFHPLFFVSLHYLFLLFSIVVFYPYLSKKRRGGVGKKVSEEGREGGREKRRQGRLKERP